MHLFAGKQTEAVPEVFPELHRMQGGGIFPVIGDGDKVESLFPVACRDVFRRFHAVGAERMQMNVAFVGAQFHQVGIKGVEIEADGIHVPCDPGGGGAARGKIVQIKYEAVFLFSGEEDAQNQRAVPKFGGADRSACLFRLLAVFGSELTAHRQAADRDFIQFRQFRMGNARGDADFRFLIGGDNAGKNIEIILKALHFCSFF